jgi:hypothetical protein
MKSYALTKVNVLPGMIAAILLALVITVVNVSPVAAQTQQFQGRGVSPAQKVPKQPEQHVAEIEANTITEETLRLQKGFANPILDTKMLRFDVTENAKRFIFDETPLHADGTPAYGNEFVTEGYLYPFGTLNGTNGVNPDGSPEFPEKVIGRWICRGWHTGEGAKTVTGPWVVTHQVYDLGNKPGQTMLVSDGLELVDLNEPIMRAITGGTGQFSQARGEMRQVMIGFNQLNGVNLRVEIRVQNR